MFEAELDNLDKEIRDKMYILRAADELTMIKGVGARMSNNWFWVFEGEEDEKLLQTKTALKIVAEFI